MSVRFNPLNFSGLDFVGTSGGGGGATSKYIATFNGTTDWGSVSGGYYIITVLASTHGLGVNPNIKVFELSGSDYIELTVDQVKINPSGDIFFRVPATPDLRFAGAYLII